MKYNETQFYCALASAVRSEGVRAVTLEPFTLDSGIESAIKEAKAQGIEHEHLCRDYNMYFIDELVRNDLGYMLDPPLTDLTFKLSTPEAGRCLLKKLVKKDYDKFIEIAKKFIEGVNNYGRPTPKPKG
ncbi:hypothetical protein KY330_00290 [Candidatus Woesearchaeota archaeon]|nr:hypothetical protein [Candidatus Woesearchaeota archaeon]